MSLCHDHFIVSHPVVPNFSHAMTTLFSQHFLVDSCPSSSHASLRSLYTCIAAKVGVGRLQVLNI